MISEKRLNQFLNTSRLFGFQFQELTENHEVNAAVINILLEHFFAYKNYNGLSDQQISDIHMNFLIEYNKHLNEFAKTGKYPFQHNYTQIKDRLSYDIPLLCSSFLSKQRYTIFETLYNKLNSITGKDILVVGVGPGIELALLNHELNNINAYDLNISTFITDRFHSSKFTKGLFNYTPLKTYDIVLLIEILEHLENPFQLLSDSIKSLSKDGAIHFTTAVNVPQFDHLYNFSVNDETLENFIRENNCKIEYKSAIPHNYKVNIEAFNCYYVIKKQL